MANDDKNLNIAINLATHKTGPDAAKEIAKVTEAAKESGKASAKAAEQTTQKTVGLREAMRLLTRQFGDFGRIANVAFSLPALTVAALAVGINRLATAYNNYQAAMLEKADTINAMWAARQQAQQAAHDVMVGYNTLLGEVATSTDTLATAERKERGELEANIEARRNILKAQEQAEITAAAGDKVKEEAIKARFGKQSSSEDLAAEQSRIELQKKHLELARQEVHAAKEKAAAAAQESAAFPGTSTDAAVAANALIAAREPVLRKAQEDFQKATAGQTLAELQAAAAAAAQFSGGTELGTSAPEVRLRSALDAKARLDKARTETASAQAVISQVEDDRARRAKAVADTAADLQQKGADFQSRQRSVNEAESIFSIRSQNRADVAVASSPGAGSPLGQTILSAASGADAVRAGGKATADQAAAIAQLTHAFGLTGQNQETILRILGSLNDKEDKFDRALKTLEARINRMPANG